MIDTGTAMLGIAAARRLRRNRKTTSVTSPTDVRSVFSVSASEVRIVLERSSATFKSTSPGKEAAIRGNSALTASTASMMLAPGCR